MKKVFIILLSVFMIIGITPVSAEESVFFPIDIEEDNKKDLAAFFSIKYGENIEVDGDIVFLYCEFENQNNSLNQINIIEKDYLDKISNDYSIEKLSAENWEIYYSIILLEIDKEYNSIYRDSINFLYDFFDVYENYYKNIEIKKLSGISNKNYNDINMLLSLLPIDSEYRIKNENLLYSVNLSTYNRNNAVTYAEAHATNRAGLALYYSYSQDCTNFASQILEAGGISQNNTRSQTSGWWHTVTQTGTMSNPVFTHNRSNSWSMVMPFINYFGRYYVTTSFYSLTTNVLKGSIIAGDKYGDGDFSHIGCVTDTGVYSSTYGYKDITIAQHTTDYRKKAHETAWSTSYAKWLIIIH